MKNAALNPLDKNTDDAAQKLGAPKAEELATADKPTPSKLTPMMEQYWRVKNAHPGCLLFYRMGDFFELFHEDAEIAAKVLDIALTRRGKTEGNDIAMCGVPVHSHEAYLARLIRAGHRVAICEQTETPEEAKARGGYKALVNRDVVRVVTPGTLSEETLLDSKSANYLAACVPYQGQWGVAWLDMSTGAFFAQSAQETQLSGIIERVSPKEILLPEKLWQAPQFNEFLSALTPQPASLFDFTNANKRLQEAYGVSTLDAFGHFSGAEIAAAGSLLDYVLRTQKGVMPRISPLCPIAGGSVVDIDGATRRNLELCRTMQGERKGSLLDVIDRTQTSGGARLLADRLGAPLRDVGVIRARLAQVQSMVEQANERTRVREFLKTVPDMERALSRLALGRGQARDLAAIRDGLLGADAAREFLGQQPKFADALVQIIEGLKASDATQALVNTLQNALAADLPVNLKDGGFIAAGYLPQLDELKNMRDNSRKLIAQLQADYAVKTGVSNLKVAHNNVLGYYIEVPAKQADKLMVHGRPANDDASDNTKPDNPFVHRQTLANVVRFSTPELSTLESQIVSAADRALALEMEVFEQMRAQTLAAADDVSRIAGGLSELDVAAALGLLAAEERYCCPEIDDSLAFDIQGGRHPVVERALRAADNTAFVANDANFGGHQRLWLLTGPNMAGKSTFLRQNALIAILAQMGSFVPAISAHIGVVDKIFSRVGASDDLARGRSTFMVEMVETAAILNQATPRSFVILDEIGRGTATFDGLSIAWACLEYLHDINQCRGLFATHYHELTQLEGRLGFMSPHAMKVAEHKGEIVFLHEVAKGAADQSYGIHVAKIAGLPQAVTARAQGILDELKSSETSGKLGHMVENLPLFESVVEDVKAQQSGPGIPPELAALLDNTEPDNLSPREALEALYQLKSLYKGSI